MRRTGKPEPKVPSKPARVIVAMRLSARLAGAAGPRKDQPEADG